MAKRKKRTEEELIKDLEAEIRRIKERAAKRDAESSADGKAFLTAAKALDKAIANVTAPELLTALEAARAPLSQEMVRQGFRMPERGKSSAVLTPKPSKNGALRRRRTTQELDTLRRKVHSYVAKHPGKRLGEIAKALSVPTKDARRPTFDLIENGELRSEGVRGGTRYFAAE